MSCQLKQKLFFAILSIIFIINNVTSKKTSATSHAKSAGRNSSTGSDCINIQYFTNTFMKAETQLSNLAKKFNAHREIYKNLHSSIDDSKDPEALKKISIKQKNIVDNYIEKIEEVRNQITKILAEVDRDLSPECRDKLSATKNQVLEHIEKAFKEIK